MTEDSKDLFLVLSEREIELENETANANTAYGQTYLFLPLFKGSCRRSCVVPKIKI